MSNLKKFVIIVVSYGFGVATGYFVCKKLLEQKYHAEIKEVKETLIYNHNPKTKIGKVASVEEEEEGLKVTVEADKKAVDNIINAQLYQSTKGRPRFNYSKPDISLLAQNLEHEVSLEDESEGINVDEDEEEMEDENIEYEESLLAEADEYARLSEKNKKSNKPYIITYEDFEDRPENYDVQSLYFYSDDGYLCDDDDKVVEDDEEIVGYEFEDILNTQTTAFVRNDILRTVYEIHRIDSSYEHDILTLVETPAEREYRILARRKEISER